MWTFLEHFRFFGNRGPATRRLRGGFTLIELLAVISIMLILTSFFLLRQQNFDNATVLRSLAYSVALSVRQAQAYGTGVREFSGTFDVQSYGINFEAPTTYTLFADANGDGMSDETVQVFELRQGYSISNICGTVAGGGSQCYPSGGINVYFKRPNPDAQFHSSTGATYSNVYVDVAGPGGGVYRVVVYPTGQVSVESPT